MPRNKYPEQTVEKILDAAACLFAQKGYAHTTLQDVICLLYTSPSPRDA